MFYHNLATAKEEKETSIVWKTIGRASGEDLMNAHISGIEIGMREHEKIIQEQHLNFRSTAIKFSEEIYVKLKSDFKIKPLGMRIRTQGFSSFGTLFILAADDFYSDNVEKIYSFLYSEQKKIDSVTWSFALMPSTGELNESAMSSDGYTLSYVDPS